MSCEFAISVSEVSKTFQIYDRPHHRLLQWLFSKNQYYSEYQALDSISLQINKGETVGIIGRNGAGKSTLLQLICGTMTPSSGSVDVNGRVAALLELGSGFNPEFTGRENVYMNASILGLSKEEIDDKFDDIEQFAEIGEYIDQPVKSYSSGMYVRLAFSVSINVVPEILIIDEALSVGDELFQRKCFSKIKSLQEQGVAIIFVSHSASTIIEVCDRAILLDHGKKLHEGNPKTVVDLYHKKIFQNNESTNVSEDIEDAVQDEAPITGKWYKANGAEILNPNISDSEGKLVSILNTNKDYFYTFSVRFDKRHENICFSMSLKTKKGIQIYGVKTDSENISEVLPGQLYVVKFGFKCLMVKDTYFFNAGVMSSSSDDITYLHRGVDILAVKVVNYENDSVVGLCKLSLKNSFVITKEVDDE